MEQKKNFHLFLPLALSHHVDAFGKLPASHRHHPSFRTLTYMLLTKQSSCPSFSAPEFWKKESYTLKVEGANPHLEMRFLNLGPFQDTTTVHISVEDVMSPCVRPWLLFCGGAWRCGDWDNHTDHFCQGPGCDQQLNRFFHTFHLCLISENLPLYLIHFFFASSISGNSFFKCFIFLFILFRSEISLWQLPVNCFSNTHTHTPLSAQSWPLLTFRGR